jgi:hypothetical protein
MPSTGPPERANSSTAPITGEKRARLPPAVVAVGEAAGHHDRVDTLQIGVAVPEDLASP